MMAEKRTFAVNGTNVVSKLKEALIKLTSLSIVPKDSDRVRLQPAFRAGLMNAFIGRFVWSRMC